MKYQLMISCIAWAMLTDSYGRTWTSQDGLKTIEAEFVAAQGDSVTLLSRGKEVTFSLKKLSSKDRDWISQELERLDEIQAEKEAEAAKIEVIESENIKDDFKDALKRAKQRGGILLVKGGKPG